MIIDWQPRDADAEISCSGGAAEVDSGAEVDGGRTSCSAGVSTPAPLDDDDAAAVRFEGTCNMILSCSGLCPCVGVFCSPTARARVNDRVDALWGPAELAFVVSTRSTACATRDMAR